jgi:hypothetical protein
MILNNFSRLKEEGKTRNDYVDELLESLTTYYGYSTFLMEKFSEIFPPTEVRLDHEKKKKPNKTQNKLIHFVFFLIKKFTLVNRVFGSQ